MSFSRLIESYSSHPGLHWIDLAVIVTVAAVLFAGWTRLIIKRYFPPVIRRRNLQRIDEIEVCLTLESLQRRAKSGEFSRKLPTRW